MKKIKNVLKIIVRLLTLPIVYLSIVILGIGFILIGITEWIYKVVLNDSLINRLKEALNNFNKKGGAKNGTSQSRNNQGHKPKN